MSLESEMAYEVGKAQSLEKIKNLEAIIYKMVSNASDALSYIEYECEIMNIQKLLPITSKISFCMEGRV